MDLSIVIPCYNEVKTIREILRRVEAALLPGWDREIVVVDDGSTDGTREALQSHGSPFRLIVQDKNQGKGFAVRTGIAAATGDYVIIQDADLEYDPQDIAGLLEALDRGVGEVIYGSRNLRSAREPGFLIPRLGVWMITKLINAMYGLRLTDVWTCYKLFPRELGKYFSGGGFEAELLFTAAVARRGFTIAEAPISHHPRTYAQGKKIKVAHGIKALVLLITDRLKNFYA